MSDLTTIIARIDALQVSVQAMANALAAKADKTNLALDKNNPGGLQSAIQVMTNALAQQHLDARDQADYLGMVVYSTDWKVDRLVEVLAPWPDAFAAGQAPGGARGVGEVTPVVEGSVAG